MSSPLRRRILLLCLAALLAGACSSPSADAQSQQPRIGAPAAPPPVPILHLPRRNGSVRFAAIGDSGRGNGPQYEVSAQMQAYRKVFPFDFVIMLGDNIYDGGTPRDYRRKFELPYKPLLDGGVRFFASIGNHDDANQPSYALFNMRGQRYHTFTPEEAGARVSRTKVRLFAVDTERLDTPQIEWLDREMGKSDADWKIPFFHRPIYSSGRYARDAEPLRALLEPVFLRHGVSVAFSGHEHFYERIKPQRGITYFISGGAGSLRQGDIRPSTLTDAGFDRDYHFMLLEISERELHYQAISRDGATIDAGVVRLPQARLTPQ